MVSGATSCSWSGGVGQSESSEKQVGAGRRYTDDDELSPRERMSAVSEIQHARGAIQDAFDSPGRGGHPAVSECGRCHRFRIHHE